MRPGLDCLVAWLIGRLVVWLIGWLVERSPTNKKTRRVYHAPLDRLGVPRLRAEKANTERALRNSRRRMHVEKSVD